MNQPGSPQDVRLLLTEPGTQAGQLQTLTRDLAAALSRQPSIAATLEEGAAQPGKKGDLQAIGAILLQLAGSGGVIISLINVLKAYFERRPQLQIEVKRADGAVLKVQARDLESGEMDDLRTQIAKFLEI
jgi:hypothetical protein